MSARSAPEMSVILVTPDCYETIRRTMQYLRAQTARDRLEIVIITPSADKLGLKEWELREFFQFRVVEVGSIRSAAEAKAAGIRQASAPVIGLAEDHSYPDPGWAEALIEAHQGPWAAVGPVIGNANPGSMTSWANLFMGFGRWVEPAAAGVVDELPGHNSSYKRAILLEYGSELNAILETENFLHRDLRARGYQLYLEPASKTYHLNVSLPSASISLRFHEGREFAATRVRCEHWSLFKRLFYIGGGPFIPLVQLRRILREIRRSGRQRDLLPRILPALILGLAAWTVGEMMGYAFGAGDAPQWLSKFEFHRTWYITESDRQTVAGC